MQTQDIRLRLVIRRHGLPEIKLVWPCSCTEDLTVARVLEQVNEVVPLESGEWGLEDYAVELADGRGGSFECLHFQQVGRILKDEDQVLIRSLLTGDLKRRRLSGRHQISDDGRHLVDGLAFGRSWIRTPRDRPHIELPPRKRVRVSYEPEDDDEEQEQLLLEASRPSRSDNLKSVRIIDHYDDGDDSDSREYEEYPDDSTSMSGTSPHRTTHTGEDSEDSEIDDYADEEGDDEELETELRLLREDAAAEANIIQQEHSNLLEFEEGVGEAEDEDEDDTLDANSILNSVSEASRPSYMIPGTSITSTAVQDYSHIPIEYLIVVFQPIFPALDSADIRSALSRTNKNLRKAYLSLSMVHNPSQDFDRMMDNASFILARFFPSHPEESVNVSNAADDVEKTEIPEQVNRRSKPLIEEVEEVEDSEEIDDSEDSEESLVNGVPISPEKPRQSQQMSDSETSDSDFDESELESEDVSAEEEESGSDSESDSSDGSLESGSSSDEEEQGRISDLPVAVPAPHKPTNDSSDDSSPDGGGDGSGGLDAGGSASQNHTVQPKGPSGASDASSSESSESDSTEESDSESESESESASESESESEVEEISSKQPVQPVTKQQHIAAAPVAQVQTTDKAVSVGLTRTQKRNARRKRNKAFKESEIGQPELANGDEGDAASADFLARKQALLAAILDESQDEAEMGDVPPLDVAPQDEPREMETSVQKADEADVSDPKDKSAKRQARVDLGAGRRLVFGALGLKAPATKADEQKIRNNLMKDVRPLVNPRILQDNGSDNANEAPLSDDRDDEDPDAWKAKIVYKAVECCHEDMTLSEPPFPFVQRWDPQQKYGVMRKRKRASENYQADSSYNDSTYYYDDEFEEDYYAEGTRKKSKKKKKGKTVSLQNDTEDQDEQDVVLNYDEAPLKSSQFTDMDDLPSLPKDVKALPLIMPESAQPGMVITWNQLVMSKATKWQPEMLPFTGLIIAGGEDGGVHVILARRDREHNEKVYDEVTGQRIYDKFEAPDLDEASEEEEEEDTGFRSLQWTEMLEPRLLQQAPTDEMIQTSINSTKAATLGDEMPSRHDQVSEFQLEEVALESRPSTGQVRMAIEDDLMYDSLGTQVNLESLSIQSGQRLPRLDLSMSEVQISTASNSFEFAGQLNSNNPPRTVDAQPDHVLTAAANPPPAHSPKSNCWVEREDETAADQEAELGPSLADAMAEEVSNSNTLTSKMTQPSGEEEEEEEGEQGEESISAHSNGASHSDGIIALSQFSIPSGRQPRTTYSMENALHNDTIIPETLPQLRETTPMPNDSKSQTTPSSPSSSSSSPFPSLEEIFMSAQPTQSSGKKRETPSLSASQAVPAGDMEYDEAMRKLDEGHESDASPEKRQEEEEEDEEVVDSKVFPNATQPSLHTGLLNDDLPTLPTSLSQPEKRKDDKSPFVIPAGSQIIVLSSSPASSSGMPDENNESEHERGHLVKRRGALPTGPGWVRKGARNEREALRSEKREKAATSSRTGRRRRPEPEPLSLAPLVSAVSKYKGRKG